MCGGVVRVTPTVVPVSGVEPAASQVSKVI